MSILSAKGSGVASIAPVRRKRKTAVFLRLAGQQAEKIV